MNRLFFKTYFEDLNMNEMVENNIKNSFISKYEWKDIGIDSLLLKGFQNEYNWSSTYEVVNAMYPMGGPC